MRFVENEVLLRFLRVQNDKREIFLSKLVLTHEYLVRVTLVVYLEESAEYLQL